MFQQGEYVPAGWVVGTVKFSTMGVGGSGTNSGIMVWELQSAFILKRNVLVLQNSWVC